MSGIGRRRLAAQKDTSNSSYQKRRREIFEAAGHVFKKKGFQSASLGDIAKYMGTDRANLYYYVSSKQELLDGVVSTPVRENVERARQIAASDATAPEKIREIVLDLMRSYSRNYPFLYVFIQENLSHISAESEWAEEMRGINREYEEIVVSIVEEGHRDGSITIAGPPWVIAYGIIGLVAWSNRWYDPKRSPASAEEIGHAYAEMVINGIAPGSPPASPSPQSPAAD